MFLALQSTISHDQFGEKFVMVSCLSTSAMSIMCLEQTRAGSPLTAAPVGKCHEHPTIALGHHSNAIKGIHRNT